MNADSVKARLKNFAMETGHTFQEALIYYGLERTIYRIFVSKYADLFVLKGGILLYAIFDGNYERAFEDEFVNDPVHQTRWKAFLRKKKSGSFVSAPV